eukprot:SAG11_NODE_171_length_13596_cov_15.767356_3_plen_190_part_00
MQFFDGNKPAPVDSLMYASIKGGWKAGKYELVLMKEKVSEAVLRAAWSKGGDIKKGIIVLKTSDASDIDAAMNEHALAHKTEASAQTFAKGTAAAQQLRKLLKPDELVGAFAATQTHLKSTDDQIVLALCPVRASAGAVLLLLPHSQNALPTSFACAKVLPCMDCPRTQTEVAIVRHVRCGLTTSADAS